MTKQAYYRNEYQKQNPSWQDSLVFYRDIISNLVSNNTKILDIGCGHADFLKPVYDKTEFSYGIDPDAHALELNTSVKYKTVGTAESLPYGNDSFDLVITAWTLEHLPDPKKAFMEIFRVLKPGGKFIFLTPNALNYNVWIIRLIPEKFHDYFTRKLYGRQEKDTYTKQYKINTVRRIKKLSKQTGFKKTKLILNGDPSYISFNRPLFKLACTIEKILDHKLLQNMKVHIIGIIEK